MNAKKTKRMGYAPYALALAGLLVAGAGCAARQEQAAASPAAQAVQTPQQQSQQALDAARDAQKKATDQQRKAVAAQQEVQRLHQQLTQAQERARQEQAKAQQLQEQANEATRRSTQQAQDAQGQATQALTRQGEQLDRGELTVSGHVTRASEDRLVVQPPGGAPMTFTLGDDTRVRIDGRSASAAEIRQGHDALVAYDVARAAGIAGDPPTATLVEIRTGQPGAADSPRR